MKQPAVFLATSIAIASLLMLGLLSQPVEPPSQSAKAAKLELLCAASNRAVVEQICEDYRQRSGQLVSLQFGASQTLLASAEVSGTGDLYVPADDSYLAIASSRGLVDESYPFARMTVVVAVRNENDKGIKSFDDLCRDDVRLVQADPDAAAVGQLTRQVLKMEGLWERLQANTTSFRPSVNDVANDLVIGAADVGLIYDVMLANYQGLRAIEIEELTGINATVGIGRLRSAEDQAACDRFTEFMLDETGGIRRYREAGFEIIAR